MFLLVHFHISGTRLLWSFYQCDPYDYSNVLSTTPFRHGTVLLTSSLHPCAMAGLLKCKNGVDSLVWIVVRNIAMVVINCFLFQHCKQIYLNTRDCIFGDGLVTILLREIYDRWWYFWAKLGVAITINMWYTLAISTPYTARGGAMIATEVFLFGLKFVL